MGRGLSALQKWMLDEMRAHEDGTLTYVEVYIGFYGWGCHRFAWWTWGPQQRPHAEGKNFDRGRSEIATGASRRR